jgi:putative ABC transport system substrate-binding protein
MQSGQLKRREFITLLGGAAAICPTPLRAQQSGKLPIVGFLATGSGAAWGEWVAAFVNRLRELGWIEGNTVVIDIRWASGQNERISEIAAEFVARNVNMIVTSGLAVPATKKLTSTIPIVFAIANEPISTGLVANLARPGGNVTGLSLQAPDAAPKRVEILHEIVPHLRRLAILANANYPAALLEMEVVQGIGRTLGLEMIPFQIERAAELSSAFEGLNSRADALYVCGDPLAQSNRVRISIMAVAARLPTMNGNPQRRHPALGIRA